MYAPFESRRDGSYSDQDLSFKALPVLRSLYESFIKRDWNRSDPGPVVTMAASTRDLNFQRCIQRLKESKEVVNTLTKASASREKSKDLIGVGPSKFIHANAT